MALIDTLIVELSLDASKFTEGQKQAVASLKKIEEQSEKAGKGSSAYGEQLGRVFSKLKLEAVALTAALFGARGVKDFIISLTNMDAEVSRASRILKMNVADLTAWQGVVRQAGGSSEEATSALTHLSDEMFRYRTNTGGEQTIAVLQHLGIAWQDFVTGARPVSELLFELNARTQNLSEGDRRAALQQLGLSESLVRALSVRSDALKKVYDEQKALTGLTPEEAEQAEKLAQSWDKASTGVLNLGRALTSSLNPALTTFFENLARGAHATRKLLPFLPQVLRKMLGIEGSGAGGTGAPTGFDEFDSLRNSATLPIKPGAGKSSVVTDLLMNTLGVVPGIERVTSLQDPFHAFLGSGSAHNSGRALDITLKGGKGAAPHVKRMIEQRLKMAGINATVSDEYNNPSSHASGGHLHIQVGASEAARIGGGAAAIANTSNRGGDTSTSSVVVNLTVNAKDADAGSIKQAVKDLFERNNLVSQAGAGAR